MADAAPQPKSFSEYTGGHRFLQPRMIAMIDEALSSVGEYGEVRLIVEKGRLRFLVTQKSFDTLKWQPGGIRAEDR